MNRASIFTAVNLIAALSLVLFLAGCGGGGGGSNANPEELIIYVQPSPTSPSDGKSWASAYATLQDALSAAPSGSQIWVAAGSYTPGNDRSKSFMMKEGVAVYGGFNGTETSRDSRDWTHNVTILSGDIGTQGDNSDNCYHVVKGADHATLNGFTIKDGNANAADFFDNNGGGMLNNECSPTVVNCIFSNNSAGDSDDGSGQGGGIFNYKSSPTITNCIFTGNTSMLGGGGICSYKDSPVISHCTFTSNSSSGWGGGVSNYESDATIIQCTFSGNMAQHSGGLENSNCSPVLTGCTFTGNNAVSEGGGISNSGGGSPTIMNCIISENTAGNSGGGIFTENYATYSNCLISNNSSVLGGGMFNRNNIAVVNCTFYGNSAWYGGGMYNDYGSITWIRNSILWGNTAATSGDQIYDFPSDGAMPATSTSITYSSVQDGTTDNHNFTANPLLNSDLTLSSGSPCINAGDSGALPAGITTDLAGNPRIIGSSVDMGAYECQQ